VTISSPDASGTSRHLEVERKFDVLDSTPTPSFDGLASIDGAQRAPTQTLDAVYYDTAGLDLAAHHITLRRRTGGTDAGWHLKLPAGPDARTEVRRGLTPDGEDVVPAELRDVVLAVVRDRAVLPVARIVTSRTVDVLYGEDGIALAEFCDDHVAAVAAGEDTQQRWREWELELAEGAVASGSADESLLALLSTRLFDAGAVSAGHASKLARALGTSVGAPTTGVADAVHRAVAEQTEALLTWDRAVRTDGRDAVHQMRVRIRTIRSLLQASASAFELSHDATIFDELRELAAVLGTARDGEVLAKRYQQILDELPEYLVRGPIRERLIDGAHRHYRAGWRHSLTAMRSERYFRMLDTLDGLLIAGSATRVADEGRRTEAVIEDGYRRLRKRVAAATAADTEHHDLALHAIRKSAKRLRYIAAAGGVATVADAAEAIQTLLGDHQDSVVSRAYLCEQADTAYAAGEDTFSYGVLHQREADLAHRCERHLHAAVKTLGTAVAKAR
jgi:CHAD domain-containing protein